MTSASTVPRPSTWWLESEPDPAIVYVSPTSAAGVVLTPSGTTVMSAGVSAAPGKELPESNTGAVMETLTRLLWAQTDVMVA